MLATGAIDAKSAAAVLAALGGSATPGNALEVAGEDAGEGAKDEKNEDPATKAERLVARTFCCFWKLLSVLGEQCQEAETPPRLRPPQEWGAAAWSAAVAPRSVEVQQPP